MIAVAIVKADLHRLNAVASAAISNAVSRDGGDTDEVSFLLASLLATSIAFQGSDLKRAAMLAPIEARLADMVADVRPAALRREVESAGVLN